MSGGFGIDRPTGGGSGGGDVSKVGTPANNQVGVWTGDGTIEGTSGLTYDGSNFLLTGDIGATGTRITKGWYTDLQVTNSISGSVTGTAATVTGATQAAITTAANLTTVGTVTTGNVDAVVSAASTSTAGKSELTTVAEVDGGSDTGRTITPDALAGSYAGTKTLGAYFVQAGTALAVEDGAMYFPPLPASYNGMNLVSITVNVITAGTTGTTDFQVHNVTQAADMLSTKATIDSGETSTATAATPPVIDGANDDVSTGDVLRVDVDAISTTPPQGALITMEFRLP